MREKDSYFPLLGIYMLQKQLPLSGKLLSFSTLVLPKQFCRFIFENVAQSHSLNAALRQRFLQRGIFANQRIRRTFFFVHAESRFTPIRQYCICRVIHRIRLKTIFLPSPAKIQAEPMPVGWRPFPGILRKELLTGHLIRPHLLHPPKSTESSHHPAADTAA